MPKKHKHQSKQSKTAKAKPTALEAAEPSLNHGQHDSPAPSFYISGLQNTSGHSCFLNAALQMLASSSRLMSQDITQALLQVDGSPRKLMMLLQSINAVSTEKVSHSAEDLLGTLAKTHAHLDGRSQQDSHEALITLLDAVHSDIANRSCTGDQNIVDMLFTGYLRSKVTCMTCSSSSDSVQKSWILSLPVSSQAQLHADSNGPKGWSHNQKESAAAMKPSSVRDGGKSTKKLTPKAQKARDKGLRKEEKRRRKQEQQDKPTSASTFDPDRSDDDPSDDEEPQTIDQTVVGGVSGRSTSLLTRATSVKGIDLKQSMLERHGWSAPWLPGLWKLPNGDLFDVQASQTSLLISLQLCFEKENDVQWKCPKAKSTLALLQQQRNRRAPGHVKIAERGQRETIFEVPGRSHATDRSLPGIDVWSHFVDDRPTLTWEKVWTDPFDMENRKVIQVAQISENLWFENQHPSAIDEYNDPNSSAHLSHSCRFFELTLNNDLGSQYVETHQLAIPPVEFASEGDLATLSHFVAYQYNLKASEYKEGEKIVEGIIMKAQILLQCAHDALTELGPEGIGCLFGAPLNVRLEEKQQAVVEGWRSDAPVDVNVDSADIRQLFMQKDRVGDATWLYPAPDDPESAEPLPSATASMSEGYAADSSDESSASTTDASSPCSPRVLVTTATGDCVSPALEQKSCASPAPGMKRVDSWMNDKFTAQPTRSNFPPLSDRNFLLADAHDGSTPEERSAHGVISVTPPQSTLEQGPSMQGAESTVESLQKRDGSVREPSGPPADIPGESVGQVSGAMAAQSHATRTPVSCACTAGTAEADIPHAQVGCQSALRSAPSSAAVRQQGSDAALPEGRVQQSTSCSGHASCACCACSPMPSDLCRIHPEKRGILVRPDNGLRLSERQVMAERLPPLLICQLNRFQQAVTGTRKNALHVSFPFHMFVHPDIAERTGGAGGCPDDAVRYRLKAVLEHHGRNISGGHYTCYAWRPTACASVAAKIAGARRNRGRSAPVPVPKHGGAGRRKGRKDHLRNGAACASVASSPKLGMSDDSLPLSHGGSLHSDGLHPCGASMDAGSIALSTGQGSLRSEARSTVAARGCECADELDWEEIADTPQELHSVRLKSSNLHGQHVTADSGQPADVSVIHDGVESMSIDDIFVKADESLHLQMSSDQEDDIGIWVKCDDECIEEVSWQTVSSAQAYMLMYEQAS